MTIPADLSEQELNALLRHASNQLEILDRPEVPHHADEVERMRVLSLDEGQRAQLRQDALKVVHVVRAEFRRRGSR